MKRFLSPEEVPQDAIVVDARPLNPYLEMHVPGARHVDFVTPKFLIGSDADLRAFHAELERIFGAAGIPTASRVVVYDNGPENRAARTAWALEYAGCEVGIVQGGFPAWVKAGLPVSFEVPEVAVTTFRAQPRPELLATAAELKRKLESGEAIVLDARNAQEFSGEQLPPGASRGGHIPGARHFEWTGVMTPQGFKEGEALDEALAGIPEGVEVIAHCQSGARSAALYQVLKDRGYRVKNYLGSINEWVSHDDWPLEVGSGED